MNQHKPFKSERHLALDDFCCHGDCSQGRSCPREWTPVPDNEAIWVFLPFFAVFCAAVAVAIMVFT